MTRPVHFEIHADEPERAEAFYSSVFDWKFVRWGDTEPAYWLVTTGDDREPGINGGMLKRMGPPPADMQPVNSYVITIDVPDLAAHREKAAEAGGACVVETMAVAGVGWLTYFKDTEGNIFGMMQRDEKAK